MLAALQLPFTASWVDDAIKINGIWFGYGLPELLTWNEKVDLVEARLGDFGDRYISLLTCSRFACTCL